MQITQKNQQTLTPPLHHHSLTPLFNYIKRHDMSLDSDTSLVSDTNPHQYSQPTTLSLNKTIDKWTFSVTGQTGLDLLCGEALAKYLATYEDADDYQSVTVDINAESSKISSTHLLGCTRIESAWLDLRLVLDPHTLSTQLSQPNAQWVDDNNRLLGLFCLDTNTKTQLKGSKWCVVNTATTGSVVGQQQVDVWNETLGPKMHLPSGTKLCRLHLLSCCVSSIINVEMVVQYTNGTRASLSKTFGSIDVIEAIAESVRNKMNSLSSISCTSL